MAELFDDDCKLIECLQAVPEHGEDFCDTCGDCLSCYGGDPCYGTDLGEHRWVVYAWNIDAWREAHPEARPLP